jgi:hypothetical protein
VFFLLIPPALPHQRTTDDKDGVRHASAFQRKKSVCVVPFQRKKSVRVVPFQRKKSVRVVPFQRKKSVCVVPLITNVWVEPLT